MSWLIVVSIVAYTIVAFLFKAAAGQTRGDRIVVVALAVVTIAAGLLMLVRQEWGGTWLGAGIALVAGVLFYIASLYRVKALEHSPVSTVFAITNLDLIVSGMILLFIPSFATDVTGFRLLAVLTAGAAILVGTQLRGIEKISAATFISLALLSLSAIGYIVYARFFASAILFFIMIDHLAGVLLNATALRDIKRHEVQWGAAIGIAMFIGFWSLLNAIAVSGSNTTLVLLALSIKTPLTALLAVPLFKEKVTPSKVMAVVLATVALVFWEIGA